jgi:hypothetical protein
MLPSWTCSEVVNALLLVPSGVLSVALAVAMVFS